MLAKRFRYRFILASQKTATTLLVSMVVIASALRAGEAVAKPL